MAFHLRNLPTRVATGVFLVHSGLGKLKGDADQANGVHGMAAGAYPFLAQIPAPTFLRMLAVSEIGIGAALLVPFVPNRLAGLALTGFAGGLVRLYLRTSFLHEPGSIAPTEAGLAISKDIWMLGIGVGLVAED